jgi:hypothetical protein
VENANFFAMLVLISAGNAVEMTRVVRTALGRLTVSIKLMCVEHATDLCRNAQSAKPPHARAAFRIAAVFVVVMIRLARIVRDEY